MQIHTSPKHKLTFVFYHLVLELCKFILQFFLSKQAHRTQTRPDYIFLNLIKYYLYFPEIIAFLNHAKPYISKLLYLYFIQYMSFGTIQIHTSPKLIFNQ